MTGTVHYARHLKCVYVLLQLREKSFNNILLHKHLQPPMTL